MQVSQLMNPHVIYIEPEEEVSVAARMLARYNIGSLPVCTPGGKLRGIVTDRDIVLRCVAAGSAPAGTHVSSIMTREVASVSPECSLSEAAAVMAREKVRRLPVVENGRIAGILSLCDIIRAGKCDAEVSLALTEISSNISQL